MGKCLHCQAELEEAFQDRAHGVKKDLGGEHEAIFKQSRQCTGYLRRGHVGIIIFLLRENHSFYSHNFQINRSNSKKQVTSSCHDNCTDQLFSCSYATVE